VKPKCNFSIACRVIRGDLSDCGQCYEEDFDKENGKYMCTCVTCDCTFVGQKERVTCKRCDTKIKGELK
jgi:hypothetical protein